MAEEQQVDPVPAGEDQIELNLVILPEQYGQSKHYPLSKKVHEIRSELEVELAIPANSLALMNLSRESDNTQLVDGHLDQEKTLHDLTNGNNAKCSLELRINYYQEHVNEDYVMPDVLSLQVQNADGETSVVNVHVTKCSDEKPYFGGFRDKRTQIEYHHGSCQTTQTEKKQHKIAAHRETQTTEVKTRSVQSKREFGTQMTRNDLYIDDRTDVVIEANEEYFSSADFAALRLECCMIIQSHARGFFARKRVSNMRLQLSLANIAANEKMQQDQIDAELRQKREIERRMHPRSQEDFRILYSELEAWRVIETKKIADQNLPKDVKQMARKLLLHKQTKLLQTIDRLKIEAKKLNKEAKIRKDLESMTQPKVWAQQDGETTTVHTPFTTRAKELMDLYNGLSLSPTSLTTDERLDVLLHVKWTVKEFDCKLTQDIVQLVDREADLLNRGRSNKSVEGLRVRLKNLFLMFTKDAQFNPEAARFQKVARDLQKQSANEPLSTLPTAKAW